MTRESIKQFFVTHFYHRYEPNNAADKYACDHYQRRIGSTRYNDGLYVNFYVYERRWDNDPLEFRIQMEIQVNIAPYVMNVQVFTITPEELERDLDALEAFAKRMFAIEFNKE